MRHWKDIGEVQGCISITCVLVECLRNRFCFMYVCMYVCVCVHYYTEQFDLKW